MSTIADRLVAFATKQKSQLAVKFFSDKRRVYDTDTLDNHVYVNLPKNLGSRIDIQDELTKIGLVCQVYRNNKKQFIVCIDTTNL
jgi:hypothetical protein